MRMLFNYPVDELMDIMKDFNEEYGMMRHLEHMESEMLGNKNSSKDGHDIHGVSFNSLTPAKPMMAVRYSRPKGDANKVVRRRKASESSQIFNSRVALTRHGASRDAR